MKLKRGLRSESRVRLFCNNKEMVCSNKDKDFFLFVHMRTYMGNKIAFLVNYNCKGKRGEQQTP